MQHPRVGDGAAAGIDHQRIDAAGKDQARVDQHHLPRSQLAGTREGVVGIGEYRVRAATKDHVLRAVGQHHLPATGQRRAAEQDLKMGPAAGGAERDGAAVVDAATERHDRAVGNGDGARISRDRVHIEQ
ncbi:hypothetical protein D3C78_809270 [compost metagenome]